MKILIFQMINLILIDSDALQIENNVLRHSENITNNENVKNDKYIKWLSKPNY